VENVEEGEADRLLDLGITVDLDVGGRPEVVQVDALLCDEAVPANLDRSSECGGNLVAHCGLRTLGRPAAGSVVDES
jgi:hypothetical protein